MKESLFGLRDQIRDQLLYYTRDLLPQKVVMTAKKAKC
jgi:hypothetical protein